MKPVSKIFNAQNFFGFKMYTRYYCKNHKHTIISTELVFLKDLITFKKTWLLYISKYLCQRSYDTTLAQSVKLETNTYTHTHIYSKAPVKTFIWELSGALRNLFSAIFHIILWISLPFHPSKLLCKFVKPCDLFLRCLNRCRSLAWFLVLDSIEITSSLFNLSLFDMLILLAFLILSMYNWMLFLVLLNMKSGTCK